MSALRFTLPEWPALVDRTTDASRLNTVANHPDVRPWLGGSGPLDLTATLATPANLAYQASGGGFIAIGQGEGRYEAHSLFLPDGRRETVRAVAAALDHLFAASDAVELVTKIPDGNAPAAALAHLAGFRALFTMPLPWTEGTRLLTRVDRLTIDDWALRSTVAQAHGAWLHDAMEAGQRAAGSAHGPHQDDVVHNRLAGAATLMVRAGNPLKAVTFYNRWAAVTGFLPIRLVSLHPVVLDLFGMVVEHRGHEMEILSCQ